MSDARSALEQEIRERKEQLARDQAEMAQLRGQLADVEQRHEASRSALDALERALAVLIEHQPVEPAVPDSVEPAATDAAPEYLEQLPTNRTPTPDEFAAHQRFLRRQAMDRLDTQRDDEDVAVLAPDRATARGRLRPVR